MDKGQELDCEIRLQIVTALRGGHAYDTLESIVLDVPKGKRFSVPVGAERSAWQIIEHMRITLEDLASFIVNEDGSYSERKWPDEYWPEAAKPSDPQDWDSAVSGLQAARSRIEELVLDPSRDLLAQFPWGNGQTLFKESQLAIEHTAYHLGELVELARWLK